LDSWDSPAPNTGEHRSGLYIDAEAATRRHHAIAVIPATRASTSAPHFRHLHARRGGHRFRTIPSWSL